MQEKRREEEEAEAQLNEQLVHEAAYAKMARDVSHEVSLTFLNWISISLIDL